MTDLLDSLHRYVMVTEAAAYVTFVILALNLVTVVVLFTIVARMRRALEVLHTAISMNYTYNQCRVRISDLQPGETMTVTPPIVDSGREAGIPWTPSIVDPATYYSPPRGSNVPPRS